jgi:hypothetical protein
MHHFNDASEPRIKTRARGVLREILFSIILTFAAIMVAFGELRWWWIVLPYSVPLGFGVWVVFRLLRFAVGPSPGGRLISR